VLRAIGHADERFEEDHLRVLRAIRFAARFGLEVEPETWSAVGRHMGRLVRITPERIADELRRMLTAPTRGAAWGMLGDRGVDAILFRFVKLPPPPDVQPVAEFEPLFPGVRPGEPIPFGLALAAAALDWLRLVLPPEVGFRAALTAALVQQIVRGLRQALRISNDEAEDLGGALDGLRLLLDREAHTVAALKRFLARPTSRLSRDLLAAVQQEDRVERRLRDLERTDFAPRR
jgi:poly(A) polymerase